MSDSESLRKLVLANGRRLEEQVNHIDELERKNSAMTGQLEDNAVEFIGLRAENIELKELYAETLSALTESNDQLLDERGKAERDLATANAASTRAIPATHAGVLPRLSREAPRR